VRTDSFETTFDGAWNYLCIAGVAYCKCCKVEVQTRIIRSNDARGFSDRRWSMASPHPVSLTGVEWGTAKYNLTGENL
jgi:hypothetical protein